MNDAQTVKRREKVCCCDHDDVKMAMRAVAEFNDAIADTSLNVDDCNDAFAYTWKCMGEAARDKWDTASAGENQNQNGCRAACRDFI